MERRAACADAREVQQVIDQLLHVRHAVDDVMDELVGIGIEFPLVPVLDQLHVADHNAQWLLEVVRCDIGKLFQFLVERRN